MCERRVNLLVYSLSLHRHSYIGFILDFPSSIHNKQQPVVLPRQSAGTIFRVSFSNPGAFFLGHVSSVHRARSCHVQVSRPQVFSVNSSTSFILLFCSLAYTNEGRRSCGGAKKQFGPSSISLKISHHLDCRFELLRL